MKSPHNEGGLPRERSRRGKANSKSASTLLLELQEHVKGKCHLTHGLEGRFLLTQTQSAQARPQCRWRPGAQSEETAPWDSCTTPLLFSPSRSPCISSRSRRCLLRPAPHVEGVVQARKKKVWVHGLMQRAPRLVGSSREKLESKTYSIFSFCFPRDQ